MGGGFGVAVCLSLAPAAASADTVEAHLVDDEGLLRGGLTFTASDGERDRLRVSEVGRQLVFVDRAVGVRGGYGTSMRAA